MNRPFVYRSFFSFLLLLRLIFAGPLSAQAPSGSLHGRVTDPSGAVVAQATVAATSPAGVNRTAVTNGRGAYEINGLAAGAYLFTVTAPGFSAFLQENVAVAGGQAQQIDVKLEIAVQPEQVEVEADETAHVDVNPASDSAGALVIKGQDLEALSDDPDELQSELQALAGPAAGPNGGEFYIDGFSGGQLPPKSSIREIRINQNPFSAEYDKLGYGRIEIFTKPGANQYHGGFFFNDTNSHLNSKNPFVPSDLQPDYQSEMFNSNLSGPLGKHGSFFLNAERRNINDTAIVDAIDVPQPFGPGQQGVPTPSKRTNITPRIDYQFGQNNTLTVRYQFNELTQSNLGVGQLNLPSQAYNSSSLEHMLQISDTQVLSVHTINETKFQFIRSRSENDSLSSDPTINVLGAFVAGGNSIGQSSVHQDRYELQNYTSVALSKHALKFGGRLRAVRDASSSMNNANGTYTYSSVAAYNAGQPSQYSITVGQPLARLTVFDAALSAQDDWRIRRNMTLSYGLRFETQNHVSDHVDLAPRLGFAWGLGKGKSPKTVLRAGFGIFYDRIPDGLLLQAEQLNGINQTEYIQNLTSSSSTSTLPTKYQVSPNMHAPYVVQAAVSLERQLSKKSTVSITYLNSRGFDQLIARDINAPLNGVRPISGWGDIYQYESGAIFRQNQLIVNYRVGIGTRVSLFGFYSLSYANSDTGTGGASFSSGGPGAGVSVGFPSNSYNLMADYGRASFDVRHRVVLGGTLTMPYGFHLSPMIMATSGHPFNITLPDDLNGDGIFNDRPGFCTSSSTSCSGQTAYGNFDLAPTGSVIPVNYGTGPSEVTVNLRLSKTIGFGKKTGGQENLPPGGGGPGGPGGPGGGGPGGGGPPPGGGGLGPHGLTGGGGHRPGMDNQVSRAIQPHLQHRRPQPVQPGQCRNAGRRAGAWVRHLQRAGGRALRHHQCQPPDRFAGDVQLLSPAPEPANGPPRSTIYF